MENDTEQASRFLIWHRGKIAVSDKGTNLIWKSHDFLDRLRDLQPSVVPYEFDFNLKKIYILLYILSTKLIICVYDLLNTP